MASPVRTFNAWNQNGAYKSEHGHFGLIFTISKFCYLGVQKINVEYFIFFQIMEDTLLVFKMRGAFISLNHSLSVQSCLFLDRCLWDQKYTFLNINRVSHIHSFHN